MSHANEKLWDLSQERYSLYLNTNGDYRVRDRWNPDDHAQTARSVKTLSGGETFAVPLSMALALSDKLA